MVIKQAALWFIIAGFFFFRYIRANKTALYLIPNYIFLGLSVYKKNNNIYMLLVAALIVMETYLAYLKEKKHPFILRIQKGYEPGETLFHYVVFGVVILLLSVIMRLVR